jgi:hypothetical protein
MSPRCDALPITQPACRRHLAVHSCRRHLATVDSCHRQCHRQLAVEFWVRRPAARCVAPAFLRGARLPAAAWTASRSVNHANRCGNPSFQFFAILVGVTGVSSEARWHELRGRGVAMCKMQAHLSAGRHRVRTDHGLPRGRERGRVGACRSPPARASAKRRGRPSPGSRTRRGRVTVSIRLEYSEFAEKYSFTILATSIRCYFIQ